MDPSTARSSVSTSNIRSAFFTLRRSGRYRIQRENQLRSSLSSVCGFSSSGAEGLDLGSMPSACRQARRSSPSSRRASSIWGEVPPVLCVERGNGE